MNKVHKSVHLYKLMKRGLIYEIPVIEVFVLETNDVLTVNIISDPNVDIPWGWGEQ